MVLNWAAEKNMTPIELHAWRKSLGISQQEAADELGISKSTVELYEAGRRRDNGQPVEIPKYIEAACNWLSLVKASTSNHPQYATRDARLQARQLMYALSLPVWCAGFNKPDGMEFATYHAMLQFLGDIPSDETSLLEMLFPYRDPKDLRGTMIRSWSPENNGPATPVSAA